MARNPMLGGQHGIVNTASDDGREKKKPAITSGLTEGIEKPRGEISDGSRSGGRDTTDRKVGKRTDFGEIREA